MSALELAIRMDQVAAWIKESRPDSTPEQVAELMRAEVERIEQEMKDETF